jgi:DNA-binding transcriptional regulator YiaG
MNKIREFRKEFSLTRKQLSQLLNVSIRTIESWEIDRYSPSKPIMKLIDFIREKLQNSMIE